MIFSASHFRALVARLMVTVEAGFAAGRDVAFRVRPPEEAVLGLLSSSLSFSSGDWVLCESVGRASDSTRDGAEERVDELESPC